jgi:hypothetical protein
VLKKYNKPLTRTQIAIELNENPCKISKIIKALLKYNEIKCIEISRLEAQQLLNSPNYKRRLKLYYL